MAVNPALAFRKEKVGGKIFAATVIDNNDPTKNQRIKIRIDGPIHQGVPDSDLPWAIKQGHSGKGEINGVQEISIPRIGSQVAVIMMDDSDEHPLYMGAVHLSKINAELTGEDYPNVEGHIDASNNIFLVNHAKKTITITHCSGTTIHVAADGAVTFTTASNAQIGVNGNLDVAVSGVINIGGGGGVNIDGGDIHLNSGSAASPPAANPRG